MTDPTGTPVDRSTTAHEPNRESASSRVRFRSIIAIASPRSCIVSAPIQRTTSWAPIDVEEAIRLIQPPRAQDETLRGDHSHAIAASNHTAILSERRTTNLGRVTGHQRGLLSSVQCVKRQPVRVARFRRGLVPRQHGCFRRGVTQQRRRAEPALLQRFGRSHQHDPGCEYEPDTGSCADFCLVAIGLVRSESSRSQERSAGRCSASAGEAGSGRQARDARGGRRFGALATDHRAYRRDGSGAAGSRLKRHAHAVAHQTQQPGWRNARDRVGTGAPASATHPRTAARRPIRECRRRARDFSIGPSKHELRDPRASLLERSGQVSFAAGQGPRGPEPARAWLDDPPRTRLCWASACSSAARAPSISAAF